MSASAGPDRDLTKELVDQLAYQWDGALRPRLNGLTDEEYRWEPAPGSWSVRPRDAPRPEGVMSVGDGDNTIDFAMPEPVPPPVTTIAWRIGHIVVGVFGARNHSHFGGPEVSYDHFSYAGTAAEALDQLDAHQARWRKAISGLDEDALWRPVGPAEGPFATAPMISLVLHINREVIHHGAEIALLRDLWAHR
jgi:hypothetical protein